MSDRPFICKCGATFKAKHHLKSHMFLCHGIKIEKIPKHIPCLFCDKAYSYKSALHRHRRQCHPELLDHISQPLKGGKMEKTITIPRVEEETLDIEKCTFLLDHLPKQYDYTILECQKWETGFMCKISFNIETIEESNEFLEEFKSINNTRYRVVTIKRRPSLLLEKRLRCHRNSQKNKPSKKNTNCPAEFVIVIKKGTSDNKLVCKVRIYENHNHDPDIPSSCKKSKSRLKGEQKLQESIEYDVPLTTTVVESQEEDTMMSLEDGEVILEETVLSEECREEYENYKLLIVAKDIFSEICNRIENNPSAFKGALEEFIKQYKTMEDDCTLISALQSFGKFDGSSPKRRKKFSQQTYNEE